MCSKLLNKQLAAADSIAYQGKRREREAKIVIPNAKMGTTGNNPTL